MTARGRSGAAAPTRRSSCEETMTTAYTLKHFIDDLDAITSGTDDPEVITSRAAPLLEKLCRNPEAIPAGYRSAPQVQRGPRFNVTSVIWRPGDEAGSHDHETWGLVGVVDNEIQETRYVSSGKRTLGGRVALEVREVMRHRPGAVSRSRAAPRRDPCDVQPDRQGHGGDPRLRQGPGGAPAPRLRQGRHRQVIGEPEVHELLIAS